MASNEDIVFNVKLEGANSLKQLKELFKEQQDALGKAEQGTASYQKALERLGKVKDEIGDLKDKINALNPEGKVQAFTNVAGKLAGGFEAATGAAALFGAKSADVEKSLLKVQAAMAFAQGLESVAGLADAFEALKAVLLSFNPILLGIVAAIAAIGIAYKVWSDNMGDAARNDALLNAELESQQRAQSKINDEIERELKIKQALKLKASELAQEELKAEIQRYAAIRTRQILLQEVQDKTEEQHAELLKLDKEEADSYNQLTVLKIKLNDSLREEQKKAAKEYKDLEDEKTKKLIESSRSNLAISKEGQDALDANNKEVSDREAKEHGDELKAFEAQLAEQNRLDKIYTDYEDDRFKKQLAENKKIREQDAADQLALEQKTKQAKQAILTTSFNDAKALSDLYFQIQLNNAVAGSEAEKKIRKKQFDINKAFGIANAIIDGIQAVQKALDNPYPLNLILAAASGIAAAANVAKIAATQFDGGGGSSSPSLPSTNTSVPNIPNPQTAQPSTRLNPDGSPVQNTNGPTRAYVVESDITDKQKDVSRIKKQSKF